MPLYNFLERSSVLQAETFKIITDFNVTTKKNNDAFFKDLYEGVKAAMDTEDIVLIPKTPAARRKREQSETYDKENQIEEPSRRPGRKASQHAQLKISNNIKFLSSKTKLRRTSVEGNVAEILPIPPSGVKPPRRKKTTEKSLESSTAPFLAPPIATAAPQPCEPEKAEETPSNDDSVAQVRDSGKGASSGSATLPAIESSSPEPELVFEDAQIEAVKPKRGSSRASSRKVSVDEGFQDRPVSHASSRSRPQSIEPSQRNPVVLLERLNIGALQDQPILMETPPSRRSSRAQSSSTSSLASSSDMGVTAQPGKRTSNRKRTLSFDEPIPEQSEQLDEVPVPVLEEAKPLPEDNEPESAPLEEELMPVTPEQPKQPKPRARTRAVAKKVVQAEVVAEEASAAPQETEKVPEPAARTTRARTKMVCKGMKATSVVLPVVQEAAAAKATPTKVKPVEEAQPGRKRKSDEADGAEEQFHTPTKKSPCAKGSPCKRFLKALTPSSAKKFTPKPLFSPSRTMKVQEKVQAFEKVASPVCRVVETELENGLTSSTGKKPGFWKVMVQRLNVGTVEKDGRVYPNASTPVSKVVEEHVMEKEVENAMAEEKVAEPEPMEEVVVEEEEPVKEEKKNLRESLQSLRRSGGTLNQIMAKKSLARAKRISAAKDRKISTESTESFVSAASSSTKTKKQTPLNKKILKQISTGQLPSAASAVKKLPLSSKSTSRLASNLATGVTSFLPNQHAQAPKLTEAEERAKKEEEIRRRREKEEEAARKKEELLRAKAEEKKRIAEEKAQRMQAARLAKEQQMNDIQSKVASKLEKCAATAQQLKEKRDQETLRRKQLAEAKRMEVEERRRMEEDQKKAKLREEVEEEQRKALQKKKEMELRQKQLQIEREKYQKAMSTFAKSNLNTTVTLDANQTSDNYDMTPRGEKYMKLNSSEDYGIQDLSSGDSTDEEDEPRKKIPQWAQSAQLREAISQQNINPPDFNEVFPPKELMKTLRLELIFKNCRRKMRLKRTSSAVWDTPPSYKSMLQKRESL